MPNNLAYDYWCVCDICVWLEVLALSSLACCCFLLLIWASPAWCQLTLAAKSCLQAVDVRFELSSPKGPVAMEAQCVWCWLCCPLVPWMSLPLKYLLACIVGYYERQIYRAFVICSYSLDNLSVRVAGVLPVFVEFFFSVQWFYYNLALLYELTWWSVMLRGCSPRHT